MTVDHTPSPTPCPACGKSDCGHSAAAVKAANERLLAQQEDGAARIRILASPDTPTPETTT